MTDRVATEAWCPDHQLTDYCEMYIAALRAKQPGTPRPGRHRHRVLAATTVAWTMGIVTRQCVTCGVLLLDDDADEETE